MKAWAASFCLVAFCSIPAFAQDAPPDSDPKIVLATKILQETHATDRVSMLWDALVPDMVGSIKKMDPQITEDQVKLVSDTVLEELKSLLPDLITANARIYANHFTLEDLTAVDQFYASPTGQKVLAETPAILKENIQLGQALGNKVQQVALPKIIAKLRAKGVKI